VVLGVQTVSLGCAPIVVDGSSNVYVDSGTRITSYSGAGALTYRWTNTSYGRATALALRSDGILVGIKYDRLFGIKTSDGSTAFDVDLSSVFGKIVSPEHLAINPTNNDMCIGGTFDYDYSKIHVSSASGTLKWTVDAAGTAAAYDSSGNLYVPVAYNKVRSYTSAGTLRWEATLAGVTSMNGDYTAANKGVALTDDETTVLYVAFGGTSCRTATLFALAADSGSLRWSRNVLSVGSGSIGALRVAPYYANGFVYWLYRWNNGTAGITRTAIDNSSHASFSLGSDNVVLPNHQDHVTIDNRLVFIHKEQNTLRAFDLTTGSLAWQNALRTTVPCYSSENIAAGPDGTIFGIGYDRDDQGEYTVKLFRVGHAPTQPTAGTPVVGAGTATFTWTARGDALEYRVYNQNGTRLATYDGYTLSHSESGLAPNTTYTRLVEAANTWGVSSRTTLTATTLANTPGTPTSSGATSTSITVTWSANGNPAGTSYQLWRNGACIYSGTSTSFPDSGLTPGTAYLYQVRACNSGGVWTNYAQSTLYTAPNTPAAPVLQSSGALSWSQTGGRGYVVLSWTPVTGATGYKLWVFDGYAYRPFDVGNVTTWDSRVARIYPAESTLDSYGDNTQSGNLFNTVQGGEDLRDTPNKLYRKTAGATYDSANNYWFRVSAYNAGGESPYSAVTLVTLPNRTDATAPTGALTIEGGSQYTSALTVTLQVSGSDPLVPNYTTDTTDDASGVAQVQFSNDNTTWSAWEAFAANKSWTLAPGEGTKTVYGRVKDGASNVSATFSKEIYLFFDSQAPNVQMKVNDGAALTSKTSVTLSLMAADNFSGTPDLTMRFSNDWLNWSSWESYRATKDWLIPEGDGPKVIYAQVKDKAGNVATVYALITLSTQPPTVNIQKAASAVGTTGTVYVSGNAITTCFVNARKVEMTLNPGQAGSMRFSLDGLVWSEPEPALTAKTFSLPDVDGQHTVYVRFDDGQVYMQEFTLDRTPPVVDASWLGGATLTSSGSATLILNSRDNVSRQEDLEYSVDGATWHPFAQQVTVNVTGTGYRTVTVMVRDQAGNVAREVLSIYNK
jgi:hypothetical protein